MDDLESKLGAILSNPDLMKQVMSMAQSLSQSQDSPASAPQSASSPPNSLNDLNPAMLSQLAGIAAQNNVDSDQRRLLSALGPYLSGERLQKLEKAMRAAKLARLASQLTNQSKP